jgi:plastocyanin
MPDLDQRISDGLRALVERAPVEADVWPATERYVAKHRRHRRTIVGAVVAVALVTGAVATVGVLRSAGSKVVVSEPSPTTEVQPVRPSGAALAATGPIDGSFTITALPSLKFRPSAVTVTTGIYAIVLVDDSVGAHTLNFDDPTTMWSEMIVQDEGETKTARIFFGKPGNYAFYDSIPGHRAAGMAGTVTVTGTPMTLAQAEAAATMSIPTKPPSSEGSSETAVWSIRSAQDVTSASRVFTAYVTRLSCNGGVTGRVLEPTIEKVDTRVVVTFTVEALPGPHACPGNDQVPIVVDLGEPLGNRQLVDGACRSGGQAATTAFCADGSVRWKT